MSANHVLQLAQRVIARSQQTTPSLYLGIALRTAERLLECVPFVLCYVWLAGRWPDAVVRSPMLDWAPHWQLALGGLLPAVLLQWLCAYWGQRLTFFAGYQIMAVCYSSSAAVSWRSSLPMMSRKWRPFLLT